MAYEPDTDTDAAEPQYAPDAVALLDRKFQRELTAGLTSLVLLPALADAEADLY